MDEHSNKSRKKSIDLSEKTKSVLSSAPIAVHRPNDQTTNACISIRIINNKISFFSVCVRRMNEDKCVCFYVFGCFRRQFAIISMRVCARVVGSRCCNNLNAENVKVGLLALYFIFLGLRMWASAQRWNEFWNEPFAENRAIARGVCAANFARQYLFSVPIWHQWSDTY